MTRLPIIPIALSSALLLLAGCTVEAEENPAPVTTSPGTVEGSALSAGMASGEEMVAQAKAKFDEVVQHLKDKKVDLADKALAQIESMEGLSADLKERAAKLREQVDALLAGSDIAGKAGEALKGLTGGGGGG